jgi:YesN/AraC family two-component response regulator
MKNNVQKTIIKKFFEARIKNQQNFYLHPSYALEQQLLRAISRGDYEQAKELLDEINGLERAKLSKDPIRSLKNSLICSCTLFTRAIIKGGVQPENAFNLSDVFIQQIEETHDKESLVQLEYEMLYAFINTLKEEQLPSYQWVVQRALSFIHDEILQDLSLERIAEHVKVHPGYLSQVFHREVGITITEFINRKKIEESKYFLLHSNSSISDIAHLFGFCNQSYYSSLFKKYTGITPKRYRSRYTENPPTEDWLSL